MCVCVLRCFFPNRRRDAAVSVRHSALLTRFFAACVRQVHVLHPDCWSEGGLLDGGLLPQQLRPRHASSAGVIQGMYSAIRCLFFLLFICYLFHTRSQPATRVCPESFCARGRSGVSFIRRVVVRVFVVVVYVGGGGPTVMSAVLSLRFCFAKIKMVTLLRG